tara:strand:+ start:2219 stop:2533 length:315 start_codon:yes stop_codon:yes gene_type:complete
MFCPKCGSLLKPKSEGNKKIMHCSCGYKSKDKLEVKIKEKAEKAKEIEIIDKSELDLLPKMDTTCPKCGHKTAYFWLAQTRASDEPETKFLKCEKCKHTWRDYD